MIPLDANIKDAYTNGTDEEQNFVQNLSLFLCTYLKEHGQLIEKKADMQVSCMIRGTLNG
jgi:exportin-1